MLGLEGEDVERLLRRKNTDRKEDSFCFYPTKRIYFWGID